MTVGNAAVQSSEHLPPQAVQRLSGWLSFATHRNLCVFSLALPLAWQRVQQHALPTFCHSNESHPTPASTSLGILQSFHPLRPFPRSIFAISPSVRNWILLRWFSSQPDIHFQKQSITQTTMDCLDGCLLAVLVLTLIRSF